MTPVLPDQNFDTVDAFVAAINKARLAHKDRWITYVGQVCGQSVVLKSFNTTLQRLRVENVNYSTPCDCSVAVWKQTIKGALCETP